MEDRRFDGLARSLGAPARGEALSGFCWPRRPRCSEAKGPALNRGGSPSAAPATTLASASRTGTTSPSSVTTTVSTTTGNTTAAVTRATARPTKSVVAPASATRASAPPRTTTATTADQANRARADDQCRAASGALYCADNGYGYSACCAVYGDRCADDGGCCGDLGCFGGTCSYGGPDVYGGLPLGAQCSYATQCEGGGYYTDCANNGGYVPACCLISGQGCSSDLDCCGMAAASIKPPIGAPSASSRPEGRTSLTMETRSVHRRAAGGAGGASARSWRWYSPAGVMAMRIAGCSPSTSIR